MAKYFRRTLVMAAALSVSIAGSALAQAPSPLFKKNLNAPGKPLRGYVDLHTHPMAHLGFGGKVLHGAPDVGILMPAGGIYNYKGAPCNAQPVRAANMSEALGSCYSSHAGHDLFKNKCGNHIRRMVLNGLEDGKKANKPHDVEHPQGAPSFSRWPKQNDILHQQMWVDWLKRAHDSGLNVMVGLAVNSVTLATGVEANKPFDDKQSADLQIDEMKRFAGRHKWMEVAYSAADLRRIVGANKLALIIGVELDDMGNFAQSGKAPSAAQARAEVRRLHAKGVRYAFPVHLIDNYFGGTAIEEDEFARANRFHFGKWWDLGCATTADKVKHKVSSGWDLFKMMKLGIAGGTQPIPPCPSGHVNKRGLQPMGRIVLDEMMKLGMIIDIDHMSQNTVSQTFTYTQNTKGGAYPLVSGHNGTRYAGGSENNRTDQQYKTLVARSGLAGVGWSGNNALGWLVEARRVAKTGVSITLGSDINGLVAQPARRPGCIQRKCVKYSAAFPQAKTGTKTWDYNSDGVAHIGLFPDFLRDVETLGGSDVVNKLFDGAEKFAKMWERAETVSKKMR